jgi:hypothetical protein
VIQDQKQRRKSCASCILLSRMPAQAIDSVSKATAPLSVFGRVISASEAIVLLAEGIQGAWKLRPGE